MSKETELLDKLYSSFILATGKPKDFFLGLNQYINYIETTPPFNKILEELLAQPKPIEDNVKNLELIALKKLDQVHKELTDYIKKSRVDDKVINKALKEYERWLNNRIVGLPIALNIRLNRIIESLYKIPENKNFVLKYIVFSKDKTHITHYLKVKEYFDWKEAEEELEHRTKTELWGEVLPILKLQRVIKEGREQQAELTKQSKEHGSVKISYELSELNLKLGEWENIQKSKISGKPSFFKVKEFKPVIKRFRNYMLEESDKVLSSDTLSNLKNNLIEEERLAEEKIGLEKIREKLNNGYYFEWRCKGCGQSLENFVGNEGFKSIKKELDQFKKNIFKTCPGRWGKHLNWFEIKENTILFSLLTNIDIELRPIEKLKGKEKAKEPKT
jgi:hypothetical protein